LIVFSQRGGILTQALEELEILEWDKFISSFPADWPQEDLRSQIAANNRLTRRCVVALDDDPTGTQTVHDIWVLTVYDQDSLIAALKDNEPALYILTNTRSLPQARAQEVIGAATRNLLQAAKILDRPITLVSRSDSTLRGHYPAEIDAIQETLAQAGEAGFDAVCLVPAFPEGGRVTAQDVHWVRTGNQLIPAAQTAFARDAVFGYSHSHLPSWVEEKTHGRVPADRVISISIDTIRLGGPMAVAEVLYTVTGGQLVVVNSLTYRDLEVFVTGMKLAEARGKRFLFRTAASFVKVAAGITDQPLLTRRELMQGLPVSAGGLVVFGSHVPLSTSQLERLRPLENVDMVEFPADCVRSEIPRNIAVDQLSVRMNESLVRGKDVVLYTSRELITGDDPESTLDLASKVSASLVDIVNHLLVQPRFIIGKGGITSNDLATKCLKVKAARVLGQIYPGVPVWKLGPGARWPGMNYIVFPGNVGESDTVANIVQTLR
jgi:uncharacterized protein YgbK (DUF1537 family)